MQPDLTPEGQPQQGAQYIQPPQMTQQPTQSQGFYKQSSVTYQGGMTIYSDTHPAILEWSYDNRIRLYTIDTPSGQSQPLFECSPQEIKRFSFGMGIANIILVNGNRFTVHFAKGGVMGKVFTGAAASQLGGVLGMGVDAALTNSAANVEEATDLYWWRDNLAKFGVGGMQTSTRTLYKINKVGLWVIGGMFAFFLVIALIAWIAMTIAG